MTPDRAYEKFYPQLQSVMTKILTHVHDFSMLFSLVNKKKRGAWPSLNLILG